MTYMYGTHILQSENYTESKSGARVASILSIRQACDSFKLRLWRNEEALWRRRSRELWAEIEVAARRVRGFIPLQRQSSSCTRTLASLLVASQMQRFCSVNVPLCCCYCCCCCCLSSCLVTSQAPLSSSWECFVLQVLVLVAEVVESFDWTMATRLEFATRSTLRRQSHRHRRLCLQTSASKQKKCSAHGCNMRGHTG